MCAIILLPVKGKEFPYSLPSTGPKADPSVQAVSLQVPASHPPSDPIRHLLQNQCQKTFAGNGWVTTMTFGLQKKPKTCFPTILYQDSGTKREQFTVDSPGRTITWMQVRN